MITNPGIDAFTPLSTPAGQGVFTTPKDLTGGDQRNAANLNNAPDAITNRTNWLGRRTIDWRHAGTATYTPQGMVTFASNGAHGWQFNCAVNIGGLLRVVSGGDVKFEAGSALDMATGTSANFHDTVILAGVTTRTGKEVRSGSGATTVQRRSTFTHGTIANPASADLWKVDGSGDVTLAFPAGTPAGHVITVYIPAGFAAINIDVNGVNIGRQISSGATQVTNSSLPAYATFVAVSGAWECVAASPPTFTGSDPVPGLAHG